MKSYILKTNINCGNCLRTVTPFLNKVENIEEWNVNLNDPDRLLTAKGEDLTENEIVEAVKSAGFQVLK